MIESSLSLNRQEPLLLIVEDSNEDFEALHRYLIRSPIQIAIYRCENAADALAYLYQTGQYSKSDSTTRPSLILLDLNLPRTDGREVLRKIKQDDNLKKIPVVIYTTSNNPKDVQQCYEYGANSYIVKPINFTQLKRNIELLIEYWFEVTLLPENLQS